MEVKLDTVCHCANCKNEYRYDERLKTKVEESTCLTYTGLHEEL